MDNRLLAYLNKQIPARNELFNEMEQFAEKNHVPIMTLHSLEALLQLLRIQHPQAILEIGTAIGYSALRMAAVCPNAKIVTIERDQERFELAEDYIYRAGKYTQITLIKGDALEISEQVRAHGEFDVIFIDAAKGQYRRFFELYEPLLSDNGIIITDNVLFRGLVYQESVENKRLKGLVKKIRTYNEWLLQLANYDTVILPVGDGIAISRKRGGINNEKAGIVSNANKR